MAEYKVGSDLPGPGVAVYEASLGIAAESEVVLETDAVCCFLHVANKS